MPFSTYSRLLPRYPVETSHIEGLTSSEFKTCFEKHDFYHFQYAQVIFFKSCLCECTCMCIYIIYIILNIIILCKYLSLSYSNTSKYIQLLKSIHPRFPHCSFSTELQSFFLQRKMRRRVAPTCYGVTVAWRRPWQSCRTSLPVTCLLGFVGDNLDKLFPCRFPISGWMNHWEKY